MARRSVSSVRKEKEDCHGYCHFWDTEIRCDNAGKAQVATAYYKEETQGSNQTLSR